MSNYALIKLQMIYTSNYALIKLQMIVFVFTPWEASDCWEVS